jgi:phosphonate transport system permease protein
LASAIHRLPDAQASALARSYDAQIAARRRQTVLGALLLTLLVVAAGVVGEVSLPKFVANIGNFTSYIGRLFHLDNGALVFTDVSEWFWGVTQKNKWLPLLGETLLIAYVGTITGAVGAFIWSILSAQNLVQSKLLRVLARRFLEFCRTVPELVFALIFVVAFHLGPLPGILALAIHTTGALGKLFAEVVENIDMKPVEGLTAAGAGWTQMVRFAVLPQVLSNFVSYTLLRFEINVRSAGIMGFVGAGGIGQELLVSVRKFYYPDVSAILLLLIGTVMIIDLLTERMRHALIGQEGAA